MQSERFPRHLLFTAIISGILCIPIIALSILNFGMLSIWLNATVAALALLYHVIFGIIFWTRPKRDVSSAETTRPPIIAYTVWNIAALTSLIIINSIAFIIMVDITTRGPLTSTLPVERLGSHKWNLKIQIGQSFVLGGELLSLVVMFLICWMGKSQADSERKATQDEIDYGMREADAKADY